MALVSFQKAELLGGAVLLTVTVNDADVDPAWDDPEWPQGGYLVTAITLTAAEPVRLDASSVVAEKIPAGTRTWNVPKARKLRLHQLPVALGGE